MVALVLIVTIAAFSSCKTQFAGITNSPCEPLGSGPGSICEYEGPSEYLEFATNPDSCAARQEASRLLPDPHEREHGRAIYELPDGTLRISDELSGDCYELYPEVVEECMAIIPQSRDLVIRPGKLGTPRDGKPFPVRELVHNHSSGSHAHWELSLNDVRFAETYKRLNITVIRNGKSRTWINTAKGPDEYNRDRYRGHIVCDESCY